MKVQIAACLLCLMIVGGSLDKLPDPPAVKPQRNQNAVVSQIDYHVPVAVKNHASNWVARVPHFQASHFSVNQIFEGRGASYQLIFVSYATDSSPPYFS